MDSGRTMAYRKAVQWFAIDFPYAFLKVFVGFPQVFVGFAHKGTKTHFEKNLQRPEENPLRTIAEPFGQPLYLDEPLTPRAGRESPVLSP